MKTGTVSGRRTERIFLRVPIEIRGNDAEGRPFHEKTFTLIINRNGARVCSHAHLVPESRITITNLQTGVPCTFRVVAHVGKTLGEGPEWGVECLEPDRGIWGIHFPSLKVVPLSETEVDALVECQACRTREFAKLTIDQYSRLRQQSVVKRVCGRCGEETEWRFGSVEAETEQVPGQGPDRRRASRLSVKLPVRIRLQDGREQVARTENLSRTGVCFVSDLEMRAGDTIQLTVGYGGEGDTQAEIAARVVWRKPIEGTGRFAFGVQLESKS